MQFSPIVPGGRLSPFIFWCQKVLPLVYDDSLSYYEVLCKVVEYLNKTIESQNMTMQEVEDLQKELVAVQDWINKFDPNVINKILEEQILPLIYFGLNDAGYFVAYLPQSWDNIEFRTTGLDFTAPCVPDFGHLVLKY